MEEISNTSNESFLPAYLRRKRLATASENTQPSEMDTVAEESQTQAAPALPEAEDKPDESNEWKGRLLKEQNNHKQTNARLLAEVEARQKLEAELAELKNQTSKPENVPPQSATTETWSDDELDEVAMLFGGEVGKKFARYLKGQPQSMPNIEKAVEAKFEQHQAQTAAQSKATQWQQAVREQLPEIYGLLQDPQFSDWAYGREVDYMGNTAMAMINRAGETQNVALIPKIRSLIDEFNQSKQGSPQATTASPNKGAATKATAAKPKMSAKDIAHKERLKRAGKTEEMIAFLQKFDHT